SADDDNRQNCPPAAQQPYHSGHDRLGKSRQLDHFSENRTEHEHRKIVLEEADRLLHEDAGEHRGDQRRIGQKDGAERGDRSEQDHAVAAVGYEHEKRQSTQHNQKAHDCFFRYCPAAAGVAAAPGETQAVDVKIVSRSRSSSSMIFALCLTASLNKSRIETTPITRPWSTTGR